MLPRYSALALGAIVALIVSGGYQAWRQVGSIDALKSTDYGRLLIAKLVVVRGADRGRRVLPRGREPPVPGLPRPTTRTSPVDEYVDGVRCRSAVGVLVWRSRGRLRA